jgi:hypothetical protein
MTIGAAMLTRGRRYFLNIPARLALGRVCAWLWTLAHGGVEALASMWRLPTDPARHRLVIFYAGTGVGPANIAAVHAVRAHNRP